MMPAAPQNQRPPQPPLLPAPAQKLIPQPPPPPSTRPFIGRDCSAEAFSQSRAVGLKVLTVPQTRTDKGDFPIFRFGRSAATRLIPLLQPRPVSLKTHLTAPPPPPPENTAQLNLNQPQHGHPQPPVVLPLKLPRHPPPAQSPTQQKNSPRNTGSVIVLPPPCPNQSTTRLGLQKRASSGPDQATFLQHEAAHLRSLFHERGSPHSFNAKRHNSTTTAPSFLQHTCDSPSKNATHPEGCHLRHGSDAGTQRKRRNQSGWNAMCTARTLSREEPISSQNTISPAPGHELRENDSALLQPVQKDEGHAPHFASSEWKGRRYRACTYFLRNESGREKACKIVSQEPADQPVSQRRVTHQSMCRMQKAQNASCLSSPFVRSSPPREDIPAPPASVSEESSNCLGEACALPTSLQRAGKVFSACPTGFLPQSVLPLAGKSCFSCSFPAQAEETQVDKSLACAAAPGRGLEHQTKIVLQGREGFCANRCESGESSLEPCSSLAPLLPSDSSSMQRECHTVACGWSDMFLLQQGTAQSQSEIDRGSWNRIEQTNERKTNVVSDSRPPLKGSAAAPQCSEGSSAEVTGRLYFRHSLHSTRTPYNRVGEQGTASNRSMKKDEDLAIKVVKVPYFHCPNRYNDAGSSFQKRVPFFASAAHRRCGSTQMTVLSPPADAASAEKGKIPDADSASEVAIADDSSCRRTSESDTLLREDCRLQGHHCSLSSKILSLERNVVLPAASQQLRACNQRLNQSPATTILSHLPPSPLTPLAVTGNSRQRMWRSLPVAGEQPQYEHAVPNQECHVGLHRAQDTEIQESKEKMKGKGSYREQPSSYWPAPSSHARSPRYAGRGVARCRRRKQNKVRRRLKEKRRREGDTGEKKHLHAHPVPSHVAGEVPTLTKAKGEFVPRDAGQRGSFDDNAEVESENLHSTSSSTVIILDSDNNVTKGEPSGIPECEAWASSPAVVARHIKNRRLLRLDNDRLTKRLHDARFQKKCCMHLQKEVSRVFFSNSSEVRASCSPSNRQRCMEADCNNLFTPLRYLVEPPYYHDCVNPPGAVLYTFELLDRQQYAGRPQAGSYAEQPQSDMKAQWGESETLDVSEAHLRITAPLERPELPGQSLSSVHPVPTTLGPLSRSWSTTTRLPSPFCSSSQARSLTPRCSVSGDTAKARRRSAILDGREGGECGGECPSKCSSYLTTSLAPVENYCEHMSSRTDFVTGCGRHESTERRAGGGHDYLKVRNQEMETCCTSAAYCSSSYNACCDNASSTNGASSKMVPKNGHVTNSAAFTQQQWSHLEGEREAKHVKTELYRAERRRGSAQEARTPQEPDTSTGTSFGVDGRNSSGFTFNGVTATHVVNDHDNGRLGSSCSRKSVSRLAAACESGNALAHPGDEFEVPAITLARRGYGD